MKTINSLNIADNPWVWEVLESHRLKGHDIWSKGETFTHSGKEYKFGQFIFARERKNGGYAYEMLSTCISRGVDGDVYKISRTISQGKNNSGFQALDKNRVEKCENHSIAEREYAVSQFAKHLHIKKPSKGRLIMRNLGSMTFGKFFRENKASLDNHARLALTKELLRVYKKQLIEQKLVHKDLHLGNILIKVNPDKAPNQFELNIIDFGKSKYLPNETQEAFLVDFNKKTDPLIHHIWKISDAPKSVIEFLKDTHSFSEFEEFFNNITLAPTFHNQNPLEDLLSFFEALSETQPKLSKELKNQILKAVNESTANNMQPLKEAVKNCRTRLKEYPIRKPKFPMVIFEESITRQNLFYRIENYYHELEMKGQYLCENSHLKEGKELCVIVNQLREKTMDALYHSDAQERIIELQNCRHFCSELLNKNRKILNIHRNNNYIWGEVGIILSSLIVLYPLTLGINYLFTRRLGFFSETRSTIGAKKLDRDFDELLQIDSNNP